MDAFWAALSRRSEFDRLPVAALKAAQETEQYARKAASWKLPPAIESILDKFSPKDLDPDHGSPKDLDPDHGSQADTASSSGGGAGVAAAGLPA